jgi:hypothetical protein
MTAATDDTAPVEKPRMLARWPLRVLTGVWLASLPLGILFLAREWEIAGIIALTTFVGLAAVLAVAPSVLVVRHRLQHRDEPLPRRLRRSGISSGVAAVIVGALLWYLGAATEGWIGVIGLAFAVVAIAIIVLLVATPKRADALEPVRVGDTHVISAVLFALIIVIAVPKFGCACGSKASAYRSEMKSDLRNLVYAEESFLTDSARYTTDLAAMNMRMSSGVNAPRILLQGKTGWTATLTHASLPDEMCGIAVGTGTKNPIDESRPEGEPACGSPR